MSLADQAVAAKRGRATSQLRISEALAGRWLDRRSARGQTTRLSTGSVVEAFARGWAPTEPPPPPGATSGAGPDWASAHLRAFYAEIGDPTATIACANNAAWAAATHPNGESRIVFADTNLPSGGASASPVVRLTTWDGRSSVSFEDWPGKQPAIAAQPPIADANRIVIVWLAEDLSALYVADSDNGWRTVEKLTHSSPDPFLLWNPAIALDEDGNVFVAATAGMDLGKGATPEDPGRRVFLWVSPAGSGGAFEAPMQVSGLDDIDEVPEDTSDQLPTLAVSGPDDPNGACLLIAWRRDPPDNAPPTIESVAVEVADLVGATPAVTGGTYARVAPQPDDEANARCVDPSAACTRDGVFVVAYWASLDAGAAVLVQSTDDPLAGGWQKASAYSDEGRVARGATNGQFFPNACVSEDGGRVYIVWEFGDKAKEGLREIRVAWAEIGSDRAVGEFVPMDGADPPLPWSGQRDGSAPEPDTDPSNFYGEDPTWPQQSIFPVVLLRGERTWSSWVVEGGAEQGSAAAVMVHWVNWDLQKTNSFTIVGLWADET